MYNSTVLACYASNVGIVWFYTRIILTVLTVLIIYMYCSYICYQSYYWVFRPVGAEYNTIHYNTLQYNTIHYNTLQYITIHYNTLQYNTIQYMFIFCSCLYSQHANLAGTLSGHGSWVLNVAFSPDNTHFVSW